MTAKPSACTCGSWQPGDLRALLFTAACEVHADKFWPKPFYAEKPKPKRCGDCFFWMKSSLCPEERNVNGWNKGPSMSGIPCAKFQDKVAPTPPSSAGEEEKA